jgi:hypothetical protein
VGGALLNALPGVIHNPEAHDSIAVDSPLDLFFNAFCQKSFVKSQNHLNHLFADIWPQPTHR